MNLHEDFLCERAVHLYETKMFNNADNAVENQGASHNLELLHMNAMNNIFPLN